MQLSLKFPFSFVFYDGKIQYIFLQYAYACHTLTFWVKNNQIWLINNFLCISIFYFLKVPLRETECTEYKHKPTIGLLHRGQHTHGALPITSGERYNLIVWMRSSRIRNKQCPMCNGKPSLVSVEGFGDGFMQENVDVCTAV